MKLTKLQVKGLKQYLEFRAEEPTLFALFRKSWRLWLICFVILPADGWFLIWGGWPTVGWLFLGFALGILLTNIGRIRLFIAVWPALRETVDWEKLNALVQANEKDAG